MDNYFVKNQAANGGTLSLDMDQLNTDSNEIHVNLKNNIIIAHSENGEKHNVNKLINKLTVALPVEVEVWDLSSDDEYDIVCPCCGGLLGSTWDHSEVKHCFYCGQRLSWDEMVKVVPSANKE